MARIQVQDLAVDEALDAKALGLIRGGRGAKPLLLASNSLRARLDAALGRRSPPPPGAPPHPR